MLQVRCIVGTELCERFSFYGLRSILITFLTGQLGRSPSTAESVFHMFTAGCYLMPLAGAWIADRHLGRYKTILFFSLFYCVGHGTIAAFDNLAVSSGLGLRHSLLLAHSMFCMSSFSQASCPELVLVSART